MRVSTLISQLEELMKQHGDLDVETLNANWDRASVRAPKLDHRAILTGRQTKPRFASFYSGQKAVDLRCDRVIRL